MDIQTPEEFAVSFSNEWAENRLIDIVDGWYDYLQPGWVEGLSASIRARDAAVRAPLVEALEKIAHWTPGIVYGSAPVDFQEIARAALEAAKGEAQDER